MKKNNEVLLENFSDDEKVIVKAYNGDVLRYEGRNIKVSQARQAMNGKTYSRITVKKYCDECARGKDYNCKACRKKLAKK